MRNLQASKTYSVFYRFGVTFLVEMTLLQINTLFSCLFLSLFSGGFEGLGPPGEIV
jgi:hypothetical protein